MMLASCGGTKDAGKTDQALIGKSDIKMCFKNNQYFFNFHKLPLKIYFPSTFTSHFIVPYAFFTA